jgi:hypothetical protein
MSMEAQHAVRRPPPRPTITLAESVTSMPLEQLWTRLPQSKRQELLTHLTRMLAQRLASLREEEADE